eukprot:tig00000681_g3076.t1
MVAAINTAFNLSNPSSQLRTPLGLPVFDSTFMRSPYFSYSATNGGPQAVAFGAPPHIQQAILQQVAAAAAPTQAPPAPQQQQQQQQAEFQQQSSSEYGAHACTCGGGRQAGGRTAVALAQYHHGPAVPPPPPRPSGTPRPHVIIIAGTGAGARLLRLLPGNQPLQPQALSMCILQVHRLPRLQRDLRQICTLQPFDQDGTAPFQAQVTRGYLIPAAFSKV